MDTLSLYKKKLEEALELVPALSSDKKIAAVAYWNDLAEQLQEIVHKNDANYHLDTTGNESHLPIEQLTDAIYNPKIENHSLIDAIQNEPGVMINMSTTTSSPIYNISSPPINCNLRNNQLDTTTCLSNHVNSIMPLDQQVYTMLKHPNILSEEPNHQNTSKTIMNIAEILANESYCTNTEMNNLQDSHSLLEALQQDAIIHPDKTSTKLEVSGNVNINDYNSAILSNPPLDSTKLGPTNLNSEIKDGEMMPCSKLYDVPLEFSQYHPNQTIIMTQGTCLPPRVEMYTQSDRPLQQIQLYNPNSSEFLNQNVCSITSNRYKNEHPLDNKKYEKSEVTELNLLNSIKIEVESTQTDEYNGEIKLVDDIRSNNNAQHTCEVCGKSGFSTKGNLKRHFRAHSGEKPFKCEYCESCFTEKKSLKIHVRRHTGEKPYKCEICGKLFSQTGVLQSHMALHLNERKFDCQKCGKAFRQRSQLKLHLMRHDGVKRLECATCMAKFLTKGDLERHCRIHTGERPYACEICEKTFTRQQSLNEHMNRHTGRKPYDCKYCDKTFSEMSACYKHAKTHKKQAQTEAQQNIPSII